MSTTFGGKQDDIRCDLIHILWVVLPDYTFGFEIPENQSWFTDDDWIRKYPTAHNIYRIYGQSPYLYVTKTQIK